jgi:hypothetical protein
MLPAPLKSLILSTMKERPTNQIEKENAILNSVNYQAQQAILDPNLPDTYKDQVVDFAIKTIRKVAERKAAYHGKFGEGRRTRRPK